MNQCPCGQPGVKPLALTTLCRTCWDTELARIMTNRPGWGLTVGPPHDELMASIGWRRLRCWVCSATWYGPERETCTWCITSIEAMQHRTSPPVPARARTRRGNVWCPTHNHAWHGLIGTVCGAHGGPYNCNERGIALPAEPSRR